MNSQHPKNGVTPMNRGVLKGVEELLITPQKYRVPYFRDFMRVSKGVFKGVFKRFKKSQKIKKVAKRISAKNCASSLSG